jgi:hypothetical protein
MPASSTVTVQGIGESHVQSSGLHCGHLHGDWMRVSERGAITGRRRGERPGATHCPSSQGEGDAGAVYDTRVARRIHEHGAGAIRDGAATDEPGIDR